MSRKTQILTLTQMLEQLISIWMPYAPLSAIKLKELILTKNHMSEQVFLEKLTKNVEFLILAYHEAGHVITAYVTMKDCIYIGKAFLNQEACRKKGVLSEAAIMLDFEKCKDTVENYKKKLCILLAGKFFELNWVRDNIHEVFSTFGSNEIDEEQIIKLFEIFEVDENNRKSDRTSAESFLSAIKIDVEMSLGLLASEMYIRMLRGDPEMKRNDILNIVKQIPRNKSILKKFPN